MSLRKTLTRLLTKLTLLTLLALLPFVSVTQAFYSDTETSESNTFTAGSLDLGYTSPADNFAPDTLLPGDTANRSATVANLGILPFEYDQAYSYVSGSSDLCNALQLEVRNASNIVVYDNLLSLLTLVGSSPMPSGNSTTFSFKVTLPTNASSALRNTSCTFDLVARAWQEGGSYGNGFDDIEALSNTISAGDWFPPTPSLVYPPDGTVATSGSEWINNPYMDWTDVSWDDPVWYRYESSHSNATDPDGSFTAPVYISGALSNSMIPAPGTPNGTYYWHVQACDSHGCSDWSEIWLLTVDRTIQAANLGDVVINELMWMGSSTSSTGLTADEWIELRNMTSSPIILKNWVIENGGDNSSPNLTIPSGMTIPANGYFLIANYSASDPSSSLAVSPDWVITRVELLNTDEQLTLKDALGNTIDRTPAADGSWAAGINSTLKQSMERNDAPGSGLNDTDWHTCTDAGCNDLTYWDTEGNNYGTPKAENLSNILETPLEFSINSAGNAVSFRIENVAAWENLQYAIVYDSTGGPQGIGPSTIAIAGQSVIERANLKLGTCSSLGEVCVYHEGVTTITLTIRLTGGGLPDRTLEETLHL